MIGRTVGRYRIVAKLGEGGMGSVWKAEDALLGRSVALKFLSSDLAKSPESRARFIREAQAASKLDHPGIEAIYDVGESDGAVFISLRLVDGETIRDHIKRTGPLPLHTAVDIALAAADALAHAHARGILHRDISSRNLMLTRDGQVVVVDFGLALAEGVSRMTQSGVTVGTVAYMAPEVVQGQPADRRSEVYALGVVLYEMLTGSVPFQADHTASMLPAIIHEAPQPPRQNRPEVPEDLERVVLQALAKEPQRRPADMVAFLERLEKVREVLPAPAPWLEDELRVASVRRVSTGRRSGPGSLAPTETLPLAGSGRSWMVRWRRPMYLAAGAALVLGAAYAAHLWLGRGGRPTVPAPASPPYQSVAVLPFRNLSSHPETSAYLAEGLGEALITKLTQMSGLRVTPWVTSRRYREQNTALEKLAQDLHVEALLVGTYQEVGERIRGTVSLADGGSGSQVWADDFDEPLADLFTVQNRIAVHVATRLLGNLTGDQVATLNKPAGRSVDAYQSYLRGVEILQLPDKAATEEALQHFRKAVELDPTLSAAHIGIGTALNNRYFFGWGGIKDLEDAEESLQEALQFDPNSVAARRGLIRVYYERCASEQSLKQGKLVAVSGATGTEALSARAEAYLFGGLANKAVPLFKQVIEQDPANAGALWLLAVAGNWSGSPRDAIDAGEAYLEKFGEDPEVHMWVAYAYESLGDTEMALSHFDRLVQLTPEGTVWYLHVNAAEFFREIGQPDKADRVLLDHLDALEENVEKAPDNERLRGTLAAFYTLLGDINGAKEQLAHLARLRRENHESAKSLNPFGLLVDKTESIELRRGDIHRGCLPDNDLRLGPDIKDLDKVPGYGEFVAEYTAAVKRLEALY